MKTNATVFGLTLFLAIGPALGGNAVDSGDSVGIRKVITLLTEMKAQVEKEAAEDLAAFDKYKCWCQTSEAEKTAAVENAEKKIAELEAFIEEAASLEGQLKTEIETLTQDIAEDKTALETATALRAKENEEFKAEEADLKECLGGLVEAVKVLSKVQLLQAKGAKAAEVQPALLQLHRIVGDVGSRLGRFKSVMQQDLWDVMGSLSSGSDAAADAPASAAFLAQREGLLPWEKTEEQMGKEAKPNELMGAAAGAKSYNSRSGQILGLLTEMRDEFGRNLVAAQKEELSALVSFQKLRSAKLAEIAAAEKQKAQKEQLLAETMQKAADAKADLETTKEALAADQEFLVFLEKTCTQTDQEYQERSKIRAEELVALGEVLKILTADDARDLFGRTIAPVSLLQVASRHRAVEHESQQTVGTAAARLLLRRKAVQSAVRRILHVARRNKDWVLASLAVRTQLDDFAKVKIIMDKMVAELQQQQKAEYAKWETCKKDIDVTEDDIKVKTNEKEDLEEKKQSLENAISTLASDIATLQQEVADMEVSLKKAGEDRKAENQNFQTAVADQRATIQILNKALARLKDFYAQRPSLAQLRSRQEPGAAVAPPPPKPKAYAKSAGASGVMQLIDMVIEEATRGETELVVDEQHAQEAYATFANEASKSIEADRAAISEKTGLKERAAAELSETEGSLLRTGEALDGLAALLKGHHLDCDFLLKYFDIRQKARQEEISSIGEAKAILSGATFEEAAEAAEA